VCRGNWSRDETTLLSGSYLPLAPYLRRLNVAQLVLEYATQRAGDLMQFGTKELGLGVVNPRTDVVESGAAIRQGVEDALRFYAPNQIFLNPDCGFGTFSSRPMNTSDAAAAKMRAIVAAAADLRS
jgi:5-methyltetrahydropteroyltriglutamate--homocysteine methyltransferase